MHTQSSRQQLKSIATLGEVMMRLSTPGHLRLTQTQSFDAVFGGSEANVAISLANFGWNAVHVTRFPENDLGKAGTQWLQKHKVHTTFIQYGPRRMGLYFIETGSMQRSSKVIYDRFDSAFASMRPGSVDWTSIFRGVSWFHWSGITPAVSDTAAEVCLEALHAAHAQGLFVTGDINYRRNLWQYGKVPKDIMPNLIALTDYVVGGITDFENCAGITGISYEDAGHTMMRNYPNIKRLATTIRDTRSTSCNTLSAVMFDGNRLLQSKKYELDSIVDRIGAGDAFMAGLIHGWSVYQDDREVLDFATAACAWKHTIPGDINIADERDIELLMAGENVGKLLR